MPVTYVGFSSKREQLAKAAMASVSHLLGTVVTQTRSLSAPSASSSVSKVNAKTAFKSFFGANSPATVASHYGYIKSAAVDALTVEYDGAELGAKAYIFTSCKAPAPGGAFTAKLYLCPPLFDSYSVLGTNSTLGTIIHELSHLAVSTVDHKYGMKRVVETLTDSQKLTNADNYKYYAEVFQFRGFEMRALSDAYDAYTMPPKS